ncbi:Ig-like domain-containing protein [Agromyces sp. Marseille-Q5079]|uniref:Ig-like domain-containing protein n=1 Tax=Agromyces sp. Marseille-Q5079 TaxID=3439059 RepID=UPI003D9CBCCB
MRRIPAALGRHRSAVIASAVSAGLVAVIVAVAAASGGYSAQRVDLGDAAVWVANDELDSVGRANTAVHELNSVVETGGATSSIIQRDHTVFALDPDRATVAVIDPTTSEVTDTVAVPPGSTIALAGSQVVVASEGKVWTGPSDQLAELQLGADPTLNFGPEAVVSVDPDGVLFAYTPGTGLVQRVDAAESESVSQQWPTAEAVEGSGLQITSAGARWAVYDEASRRLLIEKREIDLSTVISVTDDARLQEPSADGESVAIASRSGLILVDLGTGAVTSDVVPGAEGDAATPVRHGGCLNAAWADGTAWRACGERAGTPIPLDGLGGGADLAFFANGDSLVLNDRASGTGWAAGTDYGLIDNWAALLATQPDDKTVEVDDAEDDAPLERSQVEPEAVDDEFGARPGRSSTLPVLMNDSDANGDVLAIDAVEATVPDGVRVDVVSDRQQVQVTLDATVADGFTFGYTVDDGRGGSASASVSVDVRTDDENSPPEQARDRVATVAESGRATTPVLGDWVDPDGDPFFLRSATPDGADDVSFTADGAVVFDEDKGVGPTRRVALVASDGRDDGGGELEVDVRMPGDVPLVAEPFVVLATTGEEIRIDPLRHAHGGTGSITLSSVPAKDEVQITPDYDGGTFRFRSSVERTQYLEYVVTDGSATETGLIRVEVEAPPERDTTPITVPHTAFLRMERPMDVDVLATDIDPTGGVLVVTGIDGVDEGLVTVEVIEHRILRVELVAPLPLGSTSFGYRVSNGLGEADGVVTVVHVPDPASTQPPVANADTASARVGDVIDVPVLANDEHPDALQLELAPDLETEPEAGLLFVSGDRLRYFAPDEPGEYEATYRVVAPEDGQEATATVRITVREADPETNSPPVPPAITARALAGDIVRIAVPLVGTDPDGDSVQLVGQESNPDRGVVVKTGPGWLDYEAGPYSAGTDSFEYSVIDALGEGATGTVRVGIAARPDAARNPVAVKDHVVVRPGRTVSVRVLANDSDPDGGELTIESVEPTDNQAEPQVADDHVDIPVPDVEGDYGFIYTIQNEHLGTATSFLTIDARDDAPLSRPEVEDTVLTLSDIVDRERVDVDVLAKAFLADGDTADLGVALLPDYRTAAEVLPDGRIRVDVQDQRRIIPFQVSHPDDPTVKTYAFIWVPGRDDAVPQLRRDAPSVTVTSGERVELDIEDFVIAASGRPVRITDAASVRAAHSDGEDPWVDDRTVAFRSEEGYFGPASISFSVTDGESAQDPAGRTSTIVIPIRVQPKTDQAPAFAGGSIDFEQSESKLIDLDKLIQPYLGEVDELRYQVIDPTPDGFEFELDGDELTITASPATPIGTTGSVAVSVLDEAGEGTPGRITLGVVPSTRPLAQPVADLVPVQRGRTTVVDVLANDDPTNPFHDPLRVVSVRGLDGVLPGDLTVTPNGDRSKLTVTVAADADPVNTTLQYQVADATGDPSRYAWGTVTISVQDRPDPVTAPTVTGFGDGTLDVAFGAAGFNNSPIVGYRLSLVDPGTREVVAVSDCEATTCRVPTPGNGRANAVTVQVQARNGIGLSDVVAAPGPIWSDVIPGAPQGLASAPLDGRLRISWTPVSAGNGSPVHSYVIVVGGVAGEVDAASVCTASRCSTDSSSLQNGSLVEFSVSARNEAYPAMATWAESRGAGTPFGQPVPGSIGVTGDAAAGTVTVNWSPFGGNGDPIGGYFVQRLADGVSTVPTGPQACTVTTPAPGTVVSPARGGGVADLVQVGPDVTSVTFPGAVADSVQYSFVVWGFNRAACVSTDVAGIVVRPAPGEVDAVDSAMDWMNAETWDRYISDVRPGASTLQIIAVDANGLRIGEPRAFPGSGWLRALLNRPFGETARFQVRACSAWGTCGPWSAVLPENAEPSLTFALPSGAWDPEQSTWTWASDPDNSGIPASYSCGVEGRDSGGPAESPTSCRVQNAQPEDRVWLDVEVAGVKVRYTNP